MTPTRQRRLLAISLLLVAVSVAAVLTVMALQQNMTYLYSPSEIDAGHAPAQSNFRLGGVVLEQSLKRDGSTLKVNFSVTDRFRTVPVEYTGILPDLFREGQSIIALGKMDHDRFVADQVLAKHDETYMPKEVAQAIAKAKQLQATENTAP